MGWEDAGDLSMFWVVSCAGPMYVLGGIVCGTRVWLGRPAHDTTQYIHESRSRYHPIHTRVLLMLPPNSYTSPTHDTTQYIHESHSIPPNGWY
jgi:hypothetical protein